MATGLTAPSVYILSKAKTIGDHIWPSCLCSLQEISSCSIPKVLFFWGGTLKQFRACMEANIKSVCTGHTVYSILGVLHLAVLKYHLHTHTHPRSHVFQRKSQTPDVSNLAHLRRRWKVCCGRLSWVLLLCCTSCMGILSCTGIF